MQYFKYQHEVILTSFIKCNLQVLVLLLWSVWFGICWCCKKVLQYVAIDRWLVHCKNKVLAVFEWIKKKREKRRVSAEGRSYDLPKNGNLLFDLFPALFSEKASSETQGQLVAMTWYFWRMKYFSVKGRVPGLLRLLNQYHKQFSSFHKLHPKVLHHLKIQRRPQ